MAQKSLGKSITLQRPWQGVGPFLFNMHHVDYYPEGNVDQSPRGSLTGRDIGQDFNNPSGWNMYHGGTDPSQAKIAGFPAHPHKGFETVSIMSNGWVDHADSTGAGARYAKGDVQWVTAGKGVSHSEMFPMVYTDKPNTFELYQLWLNLPAKKKLSPPEFVMLWRENVPVVKKEGVRGTAIARIIAGKWDNVVPPEPPVNSYASDPDADVAIWLLELEPHATIKVPAPNTDKTERRFYVHGTTGKDDQDANVKVNIGGIWVGNNEGFDQEVVDKVTVTNGDKPAKVLVLQGVPIGEPVAKQGPFVMNTQAELQGAYDEYRRTQFGGWPWDSQAPVYDRLKPRFAKHGDGKEEYPDGRDAQP